MNNTQKPANPLKRIFDFKGRASRREFWTYFRNLLLVAAVSSYALFFLSIGVCRAFYIHTSQVQDTCGMTALSMILLLSLLVCLLLLIAIGTRRLHDTNERGWMQLCLLVPVVGWVVFIILMSEPGTKGENRFGPAPENTNH